MLSIYEAVLAIMAFWLAWEYRRPDSLLWPGDLVPVTLEEQRTTEWLTALRPPVFAPHPGNRARRRAASEYTPRHYSRD